MCEQVAYDHYTVHGVTTELKATASGRYTNDGSIRAYFPC